MYNFQERKEKQILMHNIRNIQKQCGITLIRRVSPLDVSTTSLVSVTAWRYNPATNEIFKH